MATFSTNQARHLYVAKTFKTPSVLNSDEAGAIAVKTNNTKEHLYFEYKGAVNLTRSDLIDIKNILYAKATSADKMSRNLKSYTISLNKDINEGNPAVGLDYILRVVINQYAGMSDEDQYFKYGMVHTYSGMTSDKFYKTLALSLAKNFSREIVPLVKIEVHSEATKSKEGFDANGYMEVTPTTVDNGKSDVTNPYYAVDTLVTDIDSVRITEVEQPWTLGIKAQVPVYFTLQPVTITYEGDEVNWATITESTNGSVGNGKTIADMEYFYMGERGDVYRGVGFPNNFNTTYLVDPSKAYHTLDIHYAYVGNNEAVQKSEKDITIVCADKAELNKVISAVNTATGLTIATL